MKKTICDGILLPGRANAENSSLERREFHACSQRDDAGVEITTVIASSGVITSSGVSGGHV
eukprot:COSAG01_NODE_66723_length_269_cov_0.611765_1_plen_60_part_01